MDIDFDKSDIKGIFISPRPPCFLGVLIQARWEKCESTDAPKTAVSISLNSATLSLKAMISVGHTKVLQKNRTVRQDICVTDKNFTCYEILSPKASATASTF